jgi:hypothetical protein
MIEEVPISTSHLAVRDYLFVIGGCLVTVQEIRPKNDWPASVDIAIFT